LAGIAWRGSAERPTTIRSAGRRVKPRAARQWMRP
jgi:hypothetical protein